MSSLSVATLIVIILPIILWLILNSYHKTKLREAIQLEGYFERFSEADKVLRGHMTLDQYVASTRILYPWEIPPKTPYQIMIFDPRLEGGFPHTHGPYIMTPSLKRLTPSILEHEQVHIQQRYHPLELTLGYPIIGYVKPEDGHRANPDTNSLRYAGISSKFKDSPTSLRDLVDPADHPFEIMAYGSTK
jgi:hypothetical protein